MNWFVTFNILLNTAVSCSVYLIGRRLSRSKGIVFLCGFMYLMSRMAYYQIGQVLGLMETMALWMAIGILWYLYRYMDGEDGRKYYYLSCALYFGCLLYTSENRRSQERHHKRRDLPDEAKPYGYHSGG